MIAEPLSLDQYTLACLREADPVVQYYRAFFAFLDWSDIQKQEQARCKPGPHPHPRSAYLKAFLVALCEGKRHMSQLRLFLVQHPWLVLELGFHPLPDETCPYGFDVQRTVPTARWLRQQLRGLDESVLHSLFAQTVQRLQEEIPGLGEVLAFDVKHIYAWVKQNNPRVSIKDRYCKDRQPAGDPDCKVGVKRSTNQEQPDGSKKERKEYLWGYGSGVVAATTPDYGDVVLAEYTQPFNVNDITYFLPLYHQAVANVQHFPNHLTADAAFDAWYVYERAIWQQGIAAVPLNAHGHPDSQRAPDGVPLCAKGLRMHPTFQFSHTYGYRAQRFLCPLLFPQATGQTCDHEQFQKKKGCVKDLNWEAGGVMRVTLNRDGPLYKGLYNQRTACERINSQAQALGIERPHFRNGRSIRHLNTLIYIIINVRALKKVKSINARLLPI